MARLALIRHAPVLEKGICYGRYNPRTQDVSTKIPELVRLLQVFLATEAGSGKLITSPAQRCVEIAVGVARGLALELVREPRLQELSMGDWEGRAFAEIEKLSAFTSWMENWKTERPPGGEAPADLEKRVEEWLSELDDSPYVVVAHAGIVRTLRVLVEGRSWDEAMSLPVIHLQPYVFETSGATSS